MAEATIPVDLFNPGQVFACLGFVEAADILLGDSLGRFSFAGDGHGDDKFSLSAKGDKNPVGAVLEFLKEADVSKLELGGLANGTENPCPIPSNVKQSAWPATMKNAEHEIMLDHWGDSGTGRDNMKFWGGNVKGHGLLKGACCLLNKGKGICVEDPFAFDAIQTSSFRFDWRRDYIPLDAGFSPNDHRKIEMVGFPVVEILAAIGLSHARATGLSHARATKKTKLEYIYGVMSVEEAVPALFLRAALTGIESPIPGASFRRFRMTLGWPGKEDQARCIRDVQEL